METKKAFFELLVLGLLGLGAAFIWESLKNWAIEQKNLATEWLLDQGWIRTASVVEKTLGFVINTADRLKKLGENIKNILSGGADYLIGQVTSFGGRYIADLASEKMYGHIPSEVKRIVDDKGEYCLEV